MDEFKVGDEVEVCERHNFRPPDANDPVRWVGVIRRETKTQWVVVATGFTLEHFRKADGRQIGRIGGLIRYLRRLKNPTAAPTPQP